MMELKVLPFDGKRMIWGGVKTVVALLRRAPTAVASRIGYRAERRCVLRCIPRLAWSPTGLHRRLAQPDVAPRGRPQAIKVELSDVGAQSSEDVQTKGSMSDHVREASAT